MRPLQEAARQEVEQKEAALFSLHSELDASRAAQSALQTGKQEAEAALAAVKQDCQNVQRLLSTTEHRLQQASGGVHHLKPPQLHVTPTGFDSWQSGTT